ncbi:amino acid/amide ABC transporter ATP-binding protein 2 (HAAT family) [Ancylobacter aquaticus]|uniref:Amino acid/amide ABC transporter ATP-binding protein 2 (HAAT family) n=1 Tax=Ancylobacter aquaticus TaxID=100 RepID=A0A4R1I6E4_ANCAQ|nr:ABC transporter ATP-binding protein [Ancylobacter aquaticus]TCK30944.1 amino acid/amide ABC transporter ATP-binding protein 2 (HAAT family) [Ancylobacter aquaticus]
MAEPLLALEGVTSGYGQIRVLWGMDLAAQPGEIVALVGSNGAGKTTLLRTISGQIAPQAGTIRFNGESIGGARPDIVLKAGLAHVPEGRRLFRGLTVRDNLMLGAYLRTDRAAIARDLDWVFELFPILSDRQRQDATTLSGGEQQMCAVGRGIMSRPRLLMIDELSLGLSPRMVEHLGEALLALNRAGQTILLVEQDVMTAFELSHRAYIVENGRVARSGLSAELARDPTVSEAYLSI